MGLRFSFKMFQASWIKASSYWSYSGPCHINLWLTIQTKMGTPSFCTGEIAPVQLHPLQQQRGLLLPQWPCDSGWHPLTSKSNPLIDQPSECQFASSNIGVEVYRYTQQYNQSWRCYHVIDRMFRWHEPDTIDWLLDDWATPATPKLSKTQQN